MLQHLRVIQIIYSVAGMFRQKPCALIQGDKSGKTKPPVDIKTKVAFQYKRLILKRNFYFDVKGRVGPT